MQEIAAGNSLAYIRQYKQKCLEVLEKIPDALVAQLIDVLKGARDEERQVFLCGNGGSAATASHFATDLGKGASLGREKRFRVLSLTDNVPWITAMANDTDYSRIFVEQLQNYARPGDLLLAFSGSGNSPNVIAAVEWANRNRLVTVGITGRPGGKLGQLAQYPIFAESSHMGFIEDAHFVIQHIVGYYFMETPGS
jgi:D-sedoheptulose 7-phosphate isomerase